MIYIVHTQGMQRYLTYRLHFVLFAVKGPTDPAPSHCNFFSSFYRIVIYVSNHSNNCNLGLNTVAYVHSVKPSSDV